MLLRRIPNLQNYCSYDSARKLIVDPYAFTPSKKRDTDGMSFYREDFTTSEKVASDMAPEAGARVARISVQQLTESGITDIIPDPQKGPAGHVYIPPLKYIDRKTLTKEQKQARDKISLALAQHATENGVWARPGLADPVKMDSLGRK
jgi:hypothetical protein